MATDVNIQIGAQADITGLQKIDSGYQALLTKAKQVYQEIAAPITAVADRARQTRGLEELNRRATEIEQKIARTRLDQMQGGFGPAAGPGYLTKLRTDLERTNLERQVSQFDVAQAGQGVMPSMIRGGQFALGKTLKYGGMIAGGLGAYSLLSGIFGEMGGAKERNIAYATALSATRGRTGLDYSSLKPFYDVNDILEKLGRTALITSKDMAPLLSVSVELGKFGKVVRENFPTGYDLLPFKYDKPAIRMHLPTQLAGIANIGKELGIDASVLSELFTSGLRGGGFTRKLSSVVVGDKIQQEYQFIDIAKMMMLNTNMMHRATESLQSLGTVLSGTMHGTQGLGAVGIANFLDTMNTMGVKSYMGAGGAQAMLRVDQAFRGGGNQNFQYFQALALNPGFQERNVRLAEEWRTRPKTGTDYSTGYYDQLIADVSAELGAFSTPADLMAHFKNLGFTGAMGYVGKKFEGTMGVSNLERTFQQYRQAFGSENEGRRLFMTTQIAKDMGISFSDVGMLNKAMRDPNFARSASISGLDTKLAIKAYERFGKFKGEEKPDLLEYMKTLAKAEQMKVEAAEKLQTLKEELMPKILPLITPALDALTTNLPLIKDGVDAVANFFNVGDIDPKTVKRDYRASDETVKAFNDAIMSFVEFMKGIDVKDVGFKPGQQQSLILDLGNSKGALLVDDNSKPE